MTTKKLLGALVITTLLIGVGMLALRGGEEQESQFLIESAGESGDANVKISLNTDLPAQVETVRYEVVQGIMDDKTAKALAEQFGMSGDIVPPDDDEYTLKASNDSKKRKLTIYPEGSIIYHDSSKLWALPKTALNLPEKEDAKDIATAYLTEKGLLPEDAQVKMVVSDQLSRKNTSTGEIVENSDTNLQVIFGRELDGVPVIGPGSKLKVYIGDGGEVIGVHKVWRKLEASGTTMIKSSNSAFEELKQGKGPSLPPGYDNVTIDKVYFAYYEEGPGEERDYLEPIWVFEGQASNREETRGIEIMVSATIGQKQVVSEEIGV
ncbi:MAG TPA: hypothetical protein C5S37_04445 [Methanophagales archaeon]|nr:hypothetical protein [Methanophagales archaeon]